MTGQYEPNGVRNTCVPNPFDAGVSVDGGGQGDGGAVDGGVCAGCPDITQLLSPPNGTFTGSVHASASLQPRLRWRASTGADRYELEVDDSCSIGSFSTCQFPSPEISETALVVTNFQPTTTLPVSLAVPVGTRYYWRVRACNSSGCSAWSEVWYLDVGRERTDVNGDGYADMLVGAPTQAPAGNTDEGAAFVYFGKSNWTVPGTLATADVRLANPLTQAGGRFGVQIAAIGDVNGDGFSDLAVSAFLQDDPEVNEGLVYIYYGRQTWPATVATPSVVVDNPLDQGGAKLGESLVGGDFDGDGYADMAVTARFANTTINNAGQVYVFRGGDSLPGRVETADAVIDNPTDQANARFAYVLTGDVNGDGLVDLICAAIAYDDANVDQGGVFVYFGRRSWSGILEAADTYVQSPTAGGNE